MRPVDNLVMLRTLCCAVLLIAAACAARPERTAGNTRGEIPEYWMADESSTAQIMDEWVVSFADPALTSLVHAALNNNYGLKAAARVDAAREHALIAGAGRWPQLAFEPGYLRSVLPNAGLQADKFDAFEALFTLSWEMDVWGRIKASQQAFREEAEVVSADFQGARLSLAARTAQSYFELIEANLQAEVAEQSIKDRRVIADLVRGRFARGLTRGLDLRLVLTDLANAEAQVAQARNQIQLVTRRLEELLGRYPASRLTEAARLPKPPATLAAGMLSELLESGRIWSRLLRGCGGPISAWKAPGKHYYPGLP